MTSPIKILLVDDQSLFREAMHTWLALDSSVEVFAEAANGEEAVRLTIKHHPRTMYNLGLG